MYEFTLARLAVDSDGKSEGIYMGEYCEIDRSKQRARRLVSSAFLVLVSIAISGCGTYRWKEEVQLSDGRVIVIERTQKYTGSGGAGHGCAYCALEWAQISFGIDGKEYVWQSQRFAEEPMILDVIGNIPVVVTLPRNSCFKSEMIPGEYRLHLFTLYRNDAWEIHEEFPDQKVFSRNITNYSMHVRGRYKSYISLADKSEEIGWYSDKYDSASNLKSIRKPHCNPWK
jgi:hypothetical protein